jgi:hypothetical protein
MEMINSKVSLATAALLGHYLAVSDWRSSSVRRRRSPPKRAEPVAVLTLGFAYSFAGS